MEVGKFYKMVPTDQKCDKCGHDKGAWVREFPFGEKVGMFLGFCPSGFLKFRLSGQKQALMNGGSYEEVSVNMDLVQA